MTIEPHELLISGLRVSVVRKRIKNHHLGVYPPDGRVRVAVPVTVSDEAVRVAVISKLRWIRRQQAAFEGQARQSQREMLAGESHYYLGRRYRLAVSTAPGKSGVTIRSRNTLELRGGPDLTTEQRERVLAHWYRERLRALAALLLERWQGILGVTIERRIRPGLHSVVGDSLLASAGFRRSLGSGGGELDRTGRMRSPVVRVQIANAGC